MKKIDKRIPIFFLIFFILMTSFRIDYRFKTTVECCSDDYDYFIHASTIALDFDLNYENQTPRPFSYYENGKTTPIGFIGSGILSSPFLLIGNQVSKIINEDITREILNYRLLFYSISSIFYLLLSYILLLKTLTIFEIKINKYLLLYFFFSSGITYFAFERFSMTHSYEVFTLSLLIYISSKFYTVTKNSNYFSFLIPLVVLLCFLTRMSNYYIFLIPFITKKILIHNNVVTNKRLSTDKVFLFSSLISIFLFSLLSNILYGEIILNPQKIYGTNITASSLISSESGLLQEFISLLKTFFIIMFSSEFGLFWVSPILFSGLVCLLINFRKIYKPEIFLSLLCFGQNFLIIHVWQSTASSYGFRYLFSLIPLSLIIYFSYGSKNKFLTKYMYLFSSLGILSVLFYETTELTQLSLENQVNTFGKSIRYVEPDYVLGLFGSFLELNSYLIIFTTSFVGVVFFKLAIIFMGISKLNSTLLNLGLPVENEDFQTYLLNLSTIDISKILFLLSIFLLISYYIVFKIPKNT